MLLRVQRSMNRDPADPTRSNPGEPSPWDDFRVVPATPDPDPYGGPATEAMPNMDPYGQPTVVQPSVGQPVAAQPVPVRYDVPTYVQPAPEAVVPRAYVQPVEPAVAAPLVRDPLLDRPDNRGTWIAIAAVLALLAGGVIGYLIGHSSSDSTDPSTTLSTLAPGETVPADQAAIDERVNNIFTLLAAQARQDEGIQTPTPYPALDDLLGVLATDPAAPPATGDAATVDALTAERDALSAQVTDLEDQLTTAQATLEELQATVSTDDGATSDLQAQVDDQARQITQLQNDAAAAQTELDQARADLQTVQGQLDTANDTLADLNPQPMPNVVGTDIAALRTTARSNGWTLVERPATTTNGAPNTVATQAPAANTTVVRGSVVFVEVIKPSG